MANDFYQDPISGASNDAPYVEAYKNINMIKLSGEAVRILPPGPYTIRVNPDDTKYFRHLVNYVRFNKNGINDMEVLTHEGETLNFPLIGGGLNWLPPCVAIKVGGDFIAGDDLILHYYRTSEVF